MNRLGRIGLAGFGVIFAWLWTARYLSTEWRINEQYYYGWGVFPLALWMAWQRWGAAGRRRRGAAAMLALLAAFCFILGELLRWHDPLWRLTGGFLFAGAFLLTSALLLDRWGWPALRDELFPMCFAATALPWPVPFELFVTRRLLHLVAAGVTGAANLLGIAALQRGNVIEVATGTVGIEAACSGVESLQAGFMAALFLGEFFALPLARRIALVALGVAGAILVNFLRVLWMVRYAARHGPQAALDWHGAVGLVATAVLFSLLALLARYLSPRDEARAYRGSRGDDASYVDRFRSRASAILAMAGAVVLASPLLAWLWFAVAEGGESPAGAAPAHWTLASLAAPPEGWRSEAFPPGPREAALLRFSTREGWRLSGPDGIHAWVVHFWWKPGESLPGPAFAHTPALCLPWAGWSPQAPPQLIRLRVRGEEVPALAADFAQEGVGLSAIQILVAGGQVVPPEGDLEKIGVRFSRLARLWQAPRHQVNEEVLVYLAGGSVGREGAEEVLAVALGRE